MFKITSQLNLCGEKFGDKEKLEKTYSTFHASNVVLQQQYRERGFTKYSELISCLLVAEQNNELLMRNHQSRPTGSTPFPEANGTGFVPFPEANGTNFTSFPEANAEKFNGRGRGRGRYRGRGNGRGHGRNNSSYRGGHNGNSSSSKKNHGVGKQEKRGGPNPQDQPSKGSENLCYRCGMRGHWSRTCRIPKHLVDLYQASQKEKRKNVETNFAHINDPMEFTNVSVTDINPMGFANLDVADFFENREDDN